MDYLDPSTGISKLPRELLLQIQGTSFGILKLPPEILFHVQRYLSLSEICRLRKTCRPLR